MHELRMPSDKEIQIQTLGLMCREMRVWKAMEGWGGEDISGVCCTLILIFTWTKYT